MISIIVPIYKVEKYLHQCVDSIINQTYKNIEIILVDDGSTDKCPEICDDYAKSDSRVKVVHKSNGGLMSARQAGLAVSAGEYIGFVDGDDWIEPDMYEHFAATIEKYHPDMALCEFYSSFTDRDESSSQHLGKAYFSKAELENEIYPKMLFKGRFYSFGVNPCCWSKVFRRELLEKNLNKVTPKIKIGEDAAFVYPSLLDAESLAYIDKSLYHYRINPQSMTKKYDKNMENTILIPYEILKDKFSNYDYGLRTQLDYYLLYLVNGIVRNEADGSNTKSARQKKQTLRRFTENEDVVEAAKGLNYGVLPFHTKLVAKFLSLKSPVFLYFYSVLLRRFL